MTFRRRLTPKQREALYEREAASALDTGKGEHPICNIPFCGQPVRPGEPWDESHYPRPHAWGGTVTGVAHRKCNRLHGAQVVTPANAKANRNKRNRLGITRPGLGLKPLPGGRDDRLKRTMSGKTVLRATGEQWRPGR